VVIKEKKRNMKVEVISVLASKICIIPLGTLIFLAWRDNKGEGMAKELRV
jgi:hypothetical protein